MFRPHDGGIDDQYSVRIFTQVGENPLPDAFLCRPLETFEHAVSLSKGFRQVAPGRSGPDQPRHDIREQPIVGRARQLPILRPSTPAESRSPSPVAILIHIGDVGGNPLNVNRI